MAITVKRITFDRIKELGQKFGYIDIKGWSMSDVNECFTEFCDGDFEFD